MDIRRPEEQFDVLDDIDVDGGIETRISKWRGFWVNNIFTRTFAYLMASSVNGYRKLECTTSGILKVTTTGSIYEHNDTHSGSAPDSYGTAISFAETASKVEIWTSDYGMTIKRSNDGGSTWNDEIELEAGSYYEFEASTTDINVKNTSSGDTANYQIVGWY